MKHKNLIVLLNVCGWVGILSVCVQIFVDEKLFKLSAMKFLSYCCAGNALGMK